MKKIKLQISILLLGMLLSSSQGKAMRVSEAKSIPFYKKESHLRPRTGSPNITADVEQGLLTVNISHFWGAANIYVCDANNNFINKTSIFVDNKEQSVLDLSLINKGTYVIIIELADMTYIGIIDL